MSFFVNNLISVIKTSHTAPNWLFQWILLNHFFWFEAKYNKNSDIVILPTAGKLTLSLL